MSKHSGLPVAVIYIRLLVPLTVQNLLNEFLGQSERVLRDAATVGGGGVVGVFEVTFFGKCTKPQSRGMSG